MADEAQDKKHSATGKKLNELKRKGNVLRSRDLSGGLVFIVTIGLLVFLAKAFKRLFEGNFVYSFSSIPIVMENQNYICMVLKNIINNSFHQMLPIFILVLVVAILSPFIFGGWNFTLDVLQFNFGKLNPVNNLTKLFSPKQALIEIAKSMLKASIFFGALVGFSVVNKYTLINLVNGNMNSAINDSCSMIKDYIVILSGSLIITVMFDMFYHYLKFNNDSKMSTQEIKDETKDTEGSGEVKRKIRSKQIAMIKQRLMQAIPKADVIVTNPTHYAVALKYYRDKDNAPKVLTKGKGYIALQIRQIAISNGVTIYEAPKLARAIYYTTKIGLEIHPQLYKAVAIVLSYVYQLKNYQLGVGEAPQYVSDLQIPDDFIFDA